MDDPRMGRMRADGKIQSGEISAETTAELYCLAKDEMFCTIEVDTIRCGGCKLMDPEATASTKAETLI
jgi:hypothetical protein